MIHTDTQCFTRKIKGNSSQVFQSCQEESCLSSVSKPSNLSEDASVSVPSHRNRIEHTALLLLNLIRFKLCPEQVRNLIREYSTKEDLENWASKALVEAHLESRHQKWTIN